jgi:hypothetical protein
MKLYTVKGKHDGFGAQYQAVMSGIAICHYRNLVYYHTPFIKMEHDADVECMNEFIGIKNTYVLCENDIIIPHKWSDEVHYSEKPSIYYTDAVLEIIRNFYYSTIKPNIIVDIVIHIRRGDVTFEKYPNRYTENTVYISIINKLKILYPNRIITIVSEGSLEDFKDFPSGCNYILNKDICISFHTLVIANILIMSKGAFSYCAAILNRNIIYYQDFWLHPLDNWSNFRELT